MKRTGLARLTPLPRGRRLARTSLIARRSITTSRRMTGFSRAVKAIIFDRDRHSCVIAVLCDGHPGTAQTVHHLANRGMGGAPSANGVTNGVACCHADNGWLEDHPAAAYHQGWKRRRGTTGPVRYPDGRRWLLLADGTRRPA